MSYVAEFTIPPESFPFGKALVEMPDVEIEVDQIVPTSQSALPFFWVRGPDPDEFMAYAEREPDVSDTCELESVGDTALFRTEWTPTADVVNGLRELDATIVRAVGTAAEWRFEVRTEDRAAFNQFRDVFEADGIPVDLVRIYDLEDLLERHEEPVTGDQREVLLAALEEGYFDTPRTTTQEELGERFGVSPRAISGRLRRGMRNLVQYALVGRENT